MKNYDKTIQMYIFDGNPSGRIMCELSNWNGRIYKVARNELSAFAERPDSTYTGVYFLFAKDEDNNETIYIGEAENILLRLKQHLKDEAYWNDCVIVLSKDNALNKAHVKFLENHFYTLAKEASRSVVMNSTVPTCSSVSEYDKAMLEEFMANARLLVSTLGYKSFECLQDEQQTDESRIFHVENTRGASANGILVPDGFAVLAGSKAAATTVPRIAEQLLNYRNKLYATGVINNDNQFVKDFVFTSPSYAACVVLGRSANGRIEWKTSTGKNINEVENEQLTEE